MKNFLQDKINLFLEVPLLVLAFVMTYRGYEMIAESFVAGFALMAFAGVMVIIAHYIEEDRLSE